MGIFSKMLRQHVGEEDIAVYVADHRIEPFPYGYPYVPLLVGAARLEVEGVLDGLGGLDARWELDVPYDGLGLSQRNDRYCELTGLYWAWKESSCEGAVGLAHYRRLLGARDCRGQLLPLSAAQMAEALYKHDCLVAKREYFKYPIAHDYALCHMLDDLRETRCVLEAGSKRILRAFDEVMDGFSMHPYNIIICRRSLLDDYCSWLFGVLSQVEQRLGCIDDRPASQLRVFGYLAERLMNAWILAKGLKVAEFEVFSSDESVQEEACSRCGGEWEGEGYPDVDMKSAYLLDASCSYEMSCEEGDGVSFDHGFYVRTYDDVWQTCGCDREAALSHARDFGVAENRVTSPLSVEHRKMLGEINL